MALCAGMVATALAPEQANSFAYLVGIYIGGNAVAGIGGAIANGKSNNRNPDSSGSDAGNPVPTSPKAKRKGAR